MALASFDCTALKRIAPGSYISQPIASLHRAEPVQMVIAITKQSGGTSCLRLGGERHTSTGWWTSTVYLHSRRPSPTKIDSEESADGNEHKPVGEEQTAGGWKESVGEGVYFGHTLVPAQPNTTATVPYPKPTTSSNVNEEISINMQCVGTNCLGGWRKVHPYDVWPTNHTQ
jgi:hypothetical protein